MSNKPPVVVITGPTGSGKSSLAVKLAKLDTGLPDIEIINADSRQIYSGMDIGTDKVTREIRDQIPHHMLDIVTPDQRYSAAQFARDADTIIHEINSRGHLPVVVGGTGLYIRILTGGLADFSGPDPERRKHYREILEREGPEHLHNLLAQRDSARSQQIKTADSFRVIRALEILDSGENAIQDRQTKHAFSDSPYSSLKLVLTMDRQILYKRIDRRVDQMIANGFMNEVKSLLSEYNSTAPALDAIGYRQLIQVINGEIPLYEAVGIIKRNSRRYAKRQMTWFRKEPDVEWVQNDPDNSHEIVLQVAARIRRFYGDGAAQQKNRSADD